MVDPTVPVHPTFFYEFVWNLAGFLLLAFLLTPRRKYDGQVSLGYMAWYGLGRFFIEGLRTDSLMLGSYRVSQLLALALCVGALLLMAALHFRYRRSPATLYVDTDRSRERMELVDREIAAEKNKGKGTEPPAEASEEPAPEETAQEEAAPAEDVTEENAPAPQAEDETEGEKPREEE